MYAAVWGSLLFARRLEQQFAGVTRASLSLDSFIGVSYIFCYAKLAC